uniref:Uncharacterized protein n=1 Tax=Romanomermis culicivorax TaxID=13658 RepID=A0A915JX68_ROMCU
MLWIGLENVVAQLMDAPKPMGSQKAKSKVASRKLLTEKLCQQCQFFCSNQTTKRKLSVPIPTERTEEVNNPYSFTSHCQSQIPNSVGIIQMYYLNRMSSDSRQIKV